MKTLEEDIQFYKDNIANLDEGRGVFIPDKESADDIKSLFKRRLRDLEIIKAEKDFNKAHPWEDDR